MHRVQILHGGLPVRCEDIQLGQSTVFTRNQFSCWAARRSPRHRPHFRPKQEGLHTIKAKGCRRKMFVLRSENRHRDRAVLHPSLPSWGKSVWRLGQPFEQDFNRNKEWKRTTAPAGTGHESQSILHPTLPEEGRGPELEQLASF